MTTEATRARFLSRAQGDIEFLLGIGGSRIERSTFGEMIAKAELYAFGNDGRDPATAWRLPPRTPDCMAIKHQASEPGYEIDFGAMARIGRANRLLDTVGHADRRWRAALEALHGERGARWGRDYAEDNTSGVGNREVSLYPLTPMGRKWLVALRSKFPLSGSLRDDEVLASEYAAQKRQPNDLRRQRLKYCDEQAKTLLAEANHALVCVAIEMDDSARAIRATAARRVG